MENEMQLSNGFLITDIAQQYNMIQYSGIENNAWPLEDGVLENVFNKNQLERFEYFIDDQNVSRYSIGLVDFQLAEEYRKACILFHQNCRMLYVEIKRDLPYNSVWHNQFANGNLFLGFDVGICAYDYYSSLLADVIRRPDLLGKEVYNSLNKRGLFHSIDDVYLYLKERESAKKICPEMTFESGSMDIIALYQVL